ncbi:MAG: tetratricopeptide repeat protein [Planctomycetota bacterium]
MNESSVAASFHSAQAAYDRGSPDTAISIVSELISRSRKEPEVPALVLLGHALLGVGRHIDAADAFEKASLIAPIDDEARIALATCYARLDRVELARELFLQLALPRTLPSDLMLKVAQGLASIDAVRLAMQVCEWVTDREPTLAQAYYDLGVYSALLGNPLYLTEAQTRRALELEPKNVRFRVGLAVVLIQLDQREEALGLLEELNDSEIQALNCQSCAEKVADFLKAAGRGPLANSFESQGKVLAALKTPRTPSHLSIKGAR